MVEHLLHDPKVGGLSLASTISSGMEKTEKEKNVALMNSTLLVYESKMRLGSLGSHS
jgi:hypothetical protein